MWKKKLSDRSWGFETDCNGYCTCKSYAGGEEFWKIVLLTMEPFQGILRIRGGTSLTEMCYMLLITSNVDEMGFLLQLSPFSTLESPGGGGGST